MLANVAWQIRAVLLKTEQLALSSYFNLQRLGLGFESNDEAKASRR